MYNSVVLFELSLLLLIEEFGIIVRSKTIKYQCRGGGGRRSLRPFARSPRATLALSNVLLGPIVPVVGIMQTHRFSPGPMIFFSYISSNSGSNMPGIFFFFLFESSPPAREVWSCLGRGRVPPRLVIGREFSPGGSVGEEVYLE